MLRMQVSHWHLYRQPFSRKARKIALLTLVLKTWKQNCCYKKRHSAISLIQHSQASSVLIWDLRLISPFRCPQNKIESVRAAGHQHLWEPGQMWPPLVRHQFRVRATGFHVENLSLNHFLHKKALEMESKFLYSVLRGNISYSISFSYT